MTTEQLRRKVTKLLKDVGIAQPPVQVEHVASHLGIQVFPLPGNDAVSGAIVRQNNRTLIAVNPAHHPNRQRFTIAHELGHFCLGHMEIMGDEHVDEDFRVRFRNSHSSLALDKYEIEANKFAAALLMPEEFIDREVQRLGRPDSAAVQLLARKFRVSNQTMEYRLRNLDYLPPSL